MTNQKMLSRLDEVLRDRENLLIITHTNPDPDAISSALALSHLVRERTHLDTSIAYTGTIGRAENLAMVRLLGIKMKKLNRLNLERYDALALVDGQPGAGNTPNLEYDIIIDHHPRRRDTHAPLTVINPKIGVTATILVSWLREGKVSLTAPLATALTYGISSETENLGRETRPDDIAAYLFVYGKARLRILAEIIHASYPPTYFHTLHRALTQAVSYRQLIFTDLEEVPTPELVAEMADLLLRHRRITWSLVIGKFRKTLILSLRTSNRKGDAGRLIKNLVADPNEAGGHDSMAGGAVPLDSDSLNQYRKIAQDLRERFARLLGHAGASWKPVIDDTRDNESDPAG